MREIDISAIMNQLGFSAVQMERWQVLHMKPMVQSPDFADAHIEILPTSRMIHNAAILAVSEAIVV